MKYFLIVVLGLMGAAVRAQAPDVLLQKVRARLDQVNDTRPRVR